MKKIILLSAFIFFLASLSAQAAPRVFVSIAPQRYFVDKIGGGLVEVSVMVAPGASPHTYEPRPKQMAELAGAKAFFTIGDSFDQTWLDRIVGASPGIAVVHTEDGVRKIPMDVHHHDHHEAPPHGESAHDEPVGADNEHHDHGGLDPHIWLDPLLVKIQAENIREGLIRVAPEYAATFRANCAAFLRELDDLDRDIRALLAPIPANRRAFLVFHPSWGYFAKAHDLTQVPIEIEGKEPSPKEMGRIIAMAKETRARVVFVQPQFSEKSAAVIARQIGAAVVRLDPLAENWAENLRQAARAFADALR